MKYVVLDLEWNSIFLKPTNKYLNEIIEFGAVMLDDDLNFSSTFTAFVKPKYSKKLSARVKKLTNISNDDLTVGKSFAQASSDFKKWIGTGDCVICTWGSGDVKALVENYRALININYIPFMKKFCDLQSYFQYVLGLDTAKQIGLSAAAEILNISTESLELHRALTDGILTAQCMKKIFEPESFLLNTHDCNKSFYDRLFFKPKIISDIESRLINKSEFITPCPECGEILNSQDEWIFKSDYFRCAHTCNFCQKKYIVCVRFRKNYDGIAVKKKIDEVLPPESETGKSETGVGIS